MTRFIASSRRNPCPVCGRTKDGDCRILDTGAVFCHSRPDEEIGTESNGYRFAKRNDDGRTGTWVPADQWQDGRKSAKSFYSTPKVWWYQDPGGHNIVGYRADGYDRKQISGIAGKPVSEINGDLLPYRYNELTSHDTVYLVEGEKCVDAMWAVGLPATCFNGGCKGFKPERDAGQFGPDVTLVLCPDRDQQGILYMQKIAASYPENPKLWLRVWPDQAEFWNGKCPRDGGLDVADWLGGKDAETARQMIATAISEVPVQLATEYDVEDGILKTEAAHQKLKDFALQIQTRDSELRPTLMFERAKQLGTSLSRSQCQKYLKAADREFRGVRPNFSISPRSLRGTPQEYLWEEIVPLHQQTLVVADSKVGKTSLLLQMLLIQNQGAKTLFGKHLCQRQLKSYIVGTDQPEPNWKEMFIRVGLDPSTIGCSGNPVRYLSTMEQEVLLTPDAIINLRDMISKDMSEGEEALLIIDSFDACIRAIGYEERDAAISDPLRQLISAFEGLPVTQVIVHHEPKGALPGANAFKAARAHGSIASTVSGGIRLEKINPEKKDSAIRMKITNRSCAEHELLLERSSDGSFCCVGDGTDVLLAQAMQTLQESLQENHKQVLDFIRQATIYGEPVTAGELAETNLIPANLEGRSRTDRARQIIKSLEDRHLVKQTNHKSISGRPSNAWFAVEIPGIWSKIDGEPDGTSTISRISLTSKNEVGDNSDTIDTGSCAGNTENADRLGLNLGSQIC